MKICLKKACLILSALVLSGVARTWSATPQITVDMSQIGSTVSPLLFGDQIQWPGFGQDLLQVASLTPSTGTLRTDVLDQLHASGLTIMRYPGGTLSDFFHWEASTGPYSVRTPQMTLQLQNGSTYQYQTEIPYFGADEFAQTAQYLGTDMLITADVGMGTASEAANWLSYYESEGIKPKYWEIGNEVYFPGNTPSGDYLLDAVHVSASQYASDFDAYASALRAVDPSVLVGMVGVHYSSPGVDNWDQIVMQNVHQKIDFIAVHNSYAPEDNSSDTGSDVYAAMLAYPSVVRSNMDLIEQDIAAYAPASSRTMPIAITEHAALFTPPSNVSDLTTYANDISRSQSLAGALYSALLFNLYFRDPSVQIANHINPLSPYFQALLNVKPQNIPGIPGYDSSQPTYPVNYQLNPIREAYFYAFRLYADAAGGSLVSLNLTGSPTFTAQPVGVLASSTTVNSLDAVAVVKSGASSTLYVYVVNRDLVNSISTQVLLDNTSSQISLSAIDQLNGADYSSMNFQTSPSSIQDVQAVAGGLPGGTYTFPAHSLTRFTFTLGTISTLDQISIYPNPLRPARGDTLMHFDNLPAASRLRIYTLAGEKVQDLSVDNTGQATWDGTNGSGRKAASGVYVVYVQGGSESKTLKVAIQR